MNGQQCFCGSRYGRKGISTSCTFLCIADQNNYCGSQDAMSIYSTGQTGIFFKNTMYFHSILIFINLKTYIQVLVHQGVHK